MTRKAAIRLPDHTFQRLHELAKVTGRTTTYYIREAIQKHLEELEDVYFSEAAIDELKKGEDKVLKQFEKETNFVEKITTAKAGPWSLLKLPNGQWAAFWYAGLDYYHAESVFHGDYESGCSFVGEKEETVEHILEHLDNDNKSDPLNCCYNIQKTRKKLM